MEGRNAFPVNQREIPQNPLSDEEQVEHAVQHQLSEKAQRQLDKVQDVNATFETYYTAITNFNALPPEDRGKGKYDHGRSLDENRDRYVIWTHPKGFQYTVLLQKNGEILLSPVHG